VRRRDGAVVDAELDHGSADPGGPVLLIDDEPFGPEETAGYLLEDADEGERAELKRFGFELAEAPVGKA
jgi:hypothetical protein